MRKHLAMAAAILRYYLNAIFQGWYVAHSSAVCDSAEPDLRHPTSASRIGKVIIQTSIWG